MQHVRVGTNSDSELYILCLNKIRFTVSRLGSQLRSCSDCFLDYHRWRRESPYCRVLHLWKNYIDTVVDSQEFGNGVVSWQLKISNLGFYIKKSNITCF